MNIIKDIKKDYALWREKATQDNDLVCELEKIRDSEVEIEDRFYKDIEFGTGGLRGEIGVGTNRINIYTIRKVSQGLASYLKKNYQKPTIAIAYDSRIKSDVFAKNAASVFAANNVKVFIFKTLMPTPTLSFAVRKLGCSAGVVITASHNPAKYNGYKVYGDDGCQITLDMADKVFSEIKQIDIFKNVSCNDFEEELKNQNIVYISDDVIDDYLLQVSAQLLNKNISKKQKEELKIVYTPLNGSGLHCVTKGLKINGFSDVTVVKEQEKPDGNFPTCPYPNPEVKEALKLGLELSDKLEADLLLATDPDCDRIGIAVRHATKMELLTGNQVGILLFDYICQNRIHSKTMPKKPIAIKTIVTTDMLCPIAEKYGVEVIDVLTGFKFIGEQIGYLEQKSEQDRYIFGFEESYGYLSGSYVRDKDGVNAALLISEMAAHYKSHNKTLVDVWKDLSREHGFYENVLESTEFAGSSGFKKMQGIMSELRNNPPKKMDNAKVTDFYDYLTSNKVSYCDSKIEYIESEEKINLPKSNVVKFVLEDGSCVVVRPSGTEPKLKIYYMSQGETQQQAIEVINNLKNFFKQNYF